MKVATRIQIDPEFRALIPPLSAEELAQLEANSLGFVGHRSGDGLFELLRLMPTPIGQCYWIWSHQSSNGVETFIKKPTAVSRLPISEWSGYSFKAEAMSPIWGYPPDPSIAACEAGLRAASVYFIQADQGGGPIKIGIAAYPQSRLASIQTGSPVKLSIIGLADGGIEFERELHRRFSSDRLHGEWFSPSAALLAFIEKEAQR